LETNRETPSKLTSNIHQTSQLANSRNEVYAYLLSSQWYDENTSPVLFSMCEGRDFIAIDYSYGKFCQNQLQDNPDVFRIREYCVRRSKKKIGFTLIGTSFYRTRETNLPTYKAKSPHVNKNFPKSFLDESQMVVFDAVTTYKIFKLRETCCDLIPNYAKAKALDQFNCFF
jgi:hypothetical protein